MLANINYKELGILNNSGQHKMEKKEENIYILKSEA